MLGAGGKTVLNQATQGPSCLYSFELADGTVAVGALVDNEGDAVPPSPPSPRPPVPRPNPTVRVAGTAQVLAACLLNSRAYWQAMGRQCCIWSCCLPVIYRAPHHFPAPPSSDVSPLQPYYYGSAHARRLQQAPFVRPLLAGGANEPLAFATRRLMEASAVPLPRHLARLPGRQLSGYYGGYGSGRRLSEASAFGRQVLSVSAGAALCPP